MKTIPILTCFALLAGTLIAETVDSTTTTTTTTQYESCTALHSMHIRTSDGVEVPVEDVLIDPSEGRIVTIITDVDNRYIPLPWSVVRIGEDRSYATVDVTRERLVTAPSIERTDITSFNPDRLQKSESFFGGGAAGRGGEAINANTNPPRSRTDTGKPETTRGGEGTANADVAKRNRNGANAEATRNRDEANPEATSDQNNNRRSHARTTGAEGGNGRENSTIGRDENNSPNSETSARTRGKGQETTGGSNTMERSSAEKTNNEATTSKQSANGEDQSSKTTGLHHKRNTPDETGGGSSATERSTRDKSDTGGNNTDMSR